jgi:hypothetical protein
LELEKAQARITELESALKQAQAMPPSQHEDARKAELELEVISLRHALKQAQAQAAASAKPKPPVDHDSEAVRLKKTNKELRRKIAYLMRWHEDNR